MNIRLPESRLTGRMSITAEQAGRFAESWYAAWNTTRPHEVHVDAVMAHYAPTIEHSSPFIAKFNGTDDPWLRGIESVRAYFSRAIQKSPNPAAPGPGGPLRFNPMHVAAGHESIVLVYRRFTGELAAEAFWLDDRGLIVRSMSHYG